MAKICRAHFVLKLLEDLKGGHMILVEIDPVYLFNVLGVIIRSKQTGQRKFQKGAQEQGFIKKAVSDTPELVHIFR